MLASSDWCRTCTLGLEIRKKRKNKERGPNWTPLDLPYFGPPLNLVNLPTSRTRQV